MNYMEKDFLPGLSSVIKGFLKAGESIVKILAWAANRSVEVMKEIINGAFEMGVTLATLITETIAHPDQALNNLIKAAREIGQTTADVFRAVIVDTANQFISEVTIALVSIGEAAVEILKGVLEVSGGAIGTVIAILFETLGSYRPLNQNERDDAQKLIQEHLLPVI
jgi:hypothetical protein